MVKIYSIPECSWCQKAKQYFKLKNIAYNDINVQDDIAGREEMITLTKQQGVPVIIIDNSIIIGFDRDKIDTLLNLK